MERPNGDMSMYTLVLHSTCYQPALHTAIEPALGVVTPYSPSCVHVHVYVSLHAGSGQVSVQEAPYPSTSISIPFTTFFSKPSKLHASVP